MSVNVLFATQMHLFCTILNFSVWKNSPNVRCIVYVFPISEQIVPGHKYSLGADHERWETGRLMRIKEPECALCNELIIYLTLQSKSDR